MISSVLFHSGSCSGVWKSCLTLSLLVRFCFQHRWLHGTIFGILCVPCHSAVYRTCTKRVGVAPVLGCPSQQLLLLRQLLQPSCHCHELASDGLPLLADFLSCHQDLPIVPDDVSSSSPSHCFLSALLHLSFLTCCGCV